MIRPTLAGRGGIGAVLAQGGGGAAVWYRAGGAPMPVAAYQPKGAVSLAASYVNLANPGTYNAAPGVAPTWDAGIGWIFNGTTQYLTTGIVPTGSYSLLVRFSNSATAANEAAIGIYGGVNNNRFSVWPRTGGKASYINSAQAFSPNLYTSGVLALAGKDGYYNGTYEVTVGAGTVSTALSIYIGAANNGGAPGFYLPGRIQAAAIYSSTLNAAQVAAVSAAMAAL